LEKMRGKKRRIGAVNKDEDPPDHRVARVAVITKMLRHGRVSPRARSSTEKAWTPFAPVEGDAREDALRRRRKKR
jgi:hypothetical protein